MSVSSKLQFKKKLFFVPDYSVAFVGKNELVMEGQNVVVAQVDGAVNPPQGQRRRNRGRRNNEARLNAQRGGADAMGPRHVVQAGAVNNDPLTEKCFFPLPGEEFAPVVATGDFFPAADGLVALATQEYTALVARAYSVKRSISLSGYLYYAACLTWSRLLDLHALNQTALSFEERQFVDAMARYTPPKVLGAYLAGFGNTEFEGGYHCFRFKLDKPTYANQTNAPRFPGFFGKIRGNARYYASYPCIAVFARRIMQDLIAAGNRDVDREWDLPGEFSFVDHPLTEACIGYAPAQPIDSSTVSTFALAGITANNFPVDSEVLAVNYQLLNMVQLWIEEVRGIALAKPVTGPRGSRGQLVFEKLVGCHSDLLHCDWQGYLATKQSAAVEYAGSTFLYRTVKDYTGSGSQAKNMKFCPFAPHNPGEVIAENLNFLRNAETDDMLATENGVSARYNVSTRLRNFMATSISQ